MKRCVIFEKKNLVTAALLLAVCLALTVASVRAGEGEERRDDFVVIKAGHVITVSGEEIKEGIIVVKNGVIEAVGKNVEIPFPSRMIDARDLWVMPGLISSSTTVGTQPYRRGGVHADLKVAAEFEADGEALGDVLRWGFTTLTFSPTGSGIPGQAMTARLLADQEDAGAVHEVLSDSAYLLMEIDNPASDKRTLKKAFATAKKEIEKVEKARKDWEEKQKKKAEEAKKKAEAEKKQGEGEKQPEKKPRAKKNGEGDKQGEQKNGKQKADEDTFKPPAIKPPYLPLVDLIQKKEGVKALVAFSQASDLLHYQEAMKDFDVAQAYLLRNSRGWWSQDTDLALVAKTLGDAEAEVVLNPAINTRPLTRNRFNLPKVLIEAGCKVSLRPMDSGVSGHQSFLREVAFLVRSGLSRKSAIEAMTLRPAQLLGIAERVGTVEAGRDADLLFLTGDPFSTGTRVARVMVKGELVEGHHEIQ